MLGTSLSDESIEWIPDLSVSNPEDEIQIPFKKERNSTDDYYHLSSEILSIVRSFESIMKQVGSKDEILPEYYNCMGIYNAKLYSKYNLS